MITIRLDKFYCACCEKAGSLNEIVKCSCDKDKKKKDYISWREFEKSYSKKSEAK